MKEMTLLSFYKDGRISKEGVCKNGVFQKPKDKQDEAPKPQTQIGGTIEKV